LASSCAAVDGCVDVCANPYLGLYSEPPHNFCLLDVPEPEEEPPDDEPPEDEPVLADELLPKL
jgi:hypothetical protein